MKNRIERQIDGYKADRFFFRVMGFIFLIPIIVSAFTFDSYDFKRDSLLSPLFVEPITISYKDKLYLEFKYECEVHIYPLESTWTTYFKEVDTMVSFDNYVGSLSPEGLDYIRCTEYHHEIGKF